MSVSFDDLPAYGAELECSKCEEITAIINTIRMRVGEFNELQVLKEHQCQTCGKLSIVEGHDTNKGQCECSGELRRDKPFFCPRCGHGKDIVTI